MAAIVPRASILWSDTAMANNHPDDDDDLEQQQRLVDSNDELNDGRTPVSPLPATPVRWPA